MEECAAKVALELLLKYIVALGIILIGLAGSLVDWSKLPAAMLPAILLVIPAHEAVHVLVARALGAGRVSVKPFVRLKYLLVGAAVGFSNPFSLAKWSLVALAPLLTLSPLFLALSRLEGALGSLFSASFLLNTAGSSGDLVLLLLAASAGPGARVLDEGDSVRIFGDRPRPWAVLLLEGVYAFAVATLALLPALLTAAYALRQSLVVAGVTLVRYTPTDRGFQVSVETGVLAAALLASLAFVAVKGRRNASRIMSALEAGCRS